MARNHSRSRLRLQLETLEDRLVPSAVSPDVDLSTRGSLGTVNDAIFRQVDAQPTGTGFINSFVRLQAQGAKTVVEQGYNTDGPLQFDENKSRQFTHSLQLGNVPEVDIGGIKYRVFLLDINQKASQPFLSLDELRVSVGNAPNLSGYDAMTHQLAGLSAAYDLDAGGDHWVKLDVRLNQGSGKGDMLFYVPSGAFGDAASGSYVYLYSKFGVNFTANSGFEEWAIASSSLTCTQSSITGTVRDNNGNPIPDVVLFLDANNNGMLDGYEVYTTTDANGHYAFTGLASGLGLLSTYYVRELVPDGYTMQGEPPPPITLADCLDVAMIIDFVNSLNNPPPS
ncbi:MAG: carboxypeptidase regulatory-like domain-containing protein [Planctomycetes bacterium]|nr:carboxypeptidase regulatory-like domain-containing protein [Planctomycetota bacterium]